ncbi:MAG: IS5 family transposase [Clostridiales bacterium]|jgi:IS5 family transposase|nr:IS5 family transposase [Clostridiales bacterium]
MKQIGLYDESEALSRISKLGDKLEWLDSVIKWSVFQKALERIKPDKTQEGKGGRPPYPLLTMFKILVLQFLYNVSDEQMEYQINDRLSWKRFLKLTLSDKAPDRTTIWEFRELLTNSGCYDTLFTLFNEQMENLGIITRKGSIVDATFEDAPKPRNTREQNEQLKKGKIPEEWEANPHVIPQKDMEGAWAKKNGETHFGYKNHIKCDKDSKLITDWRLTAANVHDSQVIAALINELDRELWADSAYIGKEIEAMIRNINPEIKIHINEKGNRCHPLNEEQKENNREKSKIRIRIEHIFGHMDNSMGGKEIRCIGIIRAECVTVMRNLVYNLSRYAFLRKQKTTPVMV